MNLFLEEEGVTWFPICVNSDFILPDEDEMRKHSHLTELLLKLLQGIKQNKSTMPKLLQNPEIIVKKLNYLSSWDPKLSTITVDYATCSGNNSQCHTCSHLSRLQKVSVQLWNTSMYLGHRVWRKLHYLTVLIMFWLWGMGWTNCHQYKAE